MTALLRSIAVPGPKSDGQLPPPREFQARAILQLREAFRQGNRRIMLVAPTGGGKTVIAAMLLHECLARDKRGLFTCDRTALIDQTSERFDEYGMDHGVIQADHWRRNKLPLQVASVQTIAARARFGMQKAWPDADLILLDEAHTQYSATRQLLEQPGGPTIIGLTATPCSAGLGKQYTTLINAATMHELTEQGILVPLKILSCAQPDMQGAATTGGEWTNKAASERELVILGDVIAEYLKHAYGMKAIAFGPDIAYCAELVKRFNEAGIRAALYVSDTTKDERKQILKDFKGPTCPIRVLVSVEALAKGFDVQDIECVIDARPLRKSFSTAMQMWGRGLRSCRETGKGECLLLDFSGNIRRFYNDFVDVYHNGFRSLDDGEKLDAAARKDEEDFEAGGCPQCGYKPFKRRCLKCGHEKQTKALVNETPAEMEEIRIGGKIAASGPFDLYQQLAQYVRQHGKLETRKQRAAHLYKDMTGDWPKRSWKFEATEGMTPTSATLGKIQQIRIAFMRSRSQQQ